MNEIHEIGNAFSNPPGIEFTIHSGNEMNIVCAGGGESACVFVLCDWVSTVRHQEL